MTIEQNFREYAIKKLEQLSGRIAICLDSLTEEQIWLRSAANANAPGNLVLHLCGNVRQWIGSGVGGRPDHRTREAEFAAQGGTGREELKSSLAAVIQEAIGIIRDTSDSRLTEKITVQGHEVTVLEAIFHVVEHFSGHAGQIIFAAKAMTEKDFGFYSYLSQPVSDTQKVP